MRRLWYLRTFVANLAELRLLGSLRHLGLGLVFVVGNTLNKQIRSILILERQLPLLDSLVVAEVVRVAFLMLVWGLGRGFRTILEEYVIDQLIWNVALNDQAIAK